MFGQNRTVAVTYQAKVAGYEAGLRRMRAATDDFTERAARSATKHKADWDKVGTAALVAGGAIAAGVGLAVKRAADFEQAMSRVGAVSGATGSEMRALSEAALEAGQATVFSAMEAAEAQAELSKAGVKTADILGGALAGSLDLAAAGGLGLAQSAEIAAQAMNLFNLEGEDVTHIADVLTAAANKSAAGVDDLGQALSQGGTVAAATGLSLEETAAALAAFADSGIKGSDAGTSLKTMLQRLTPQSAEAAAEFERLGINAFDAQGNFVGLGELAGQLQTSMAGLTVEQRNAALQVMFGADAVRAANILYRQGAEGVREYVKAVDDQGAAARMAARMTDNLKGDIESLSGAFETALIKSGSGGAESLRGLVQSLESIINAYNNLPPAAQSAIFQFTAVGAAALLVSGGMIKATTSVLAFKASMEAAGFTAGPFAGKLGTVAKAAGGLLILGTVAAGSKALTDSFSQAKVGDVEDMAAALATLGEGAERVPDFGALFEEKWVLPPFRDDVETAADAMEKFALQAEMALGGNWGDKLERFLGNGSAAKFEEQVAQIDQGLADLVANGNADGAAAAFERMMSAVPPELVDEVRAMFEQYPAALDEMQVAATGAAAEQVALADSAEEAADAQRDLADAIVGVSDALMAAASSEIALAESYDSVAETLEKNGAVIDELTGKIDTSTDSGRENARALLEYAANAKTVAKDSLTAGDSIDEVAAALEGARANFVDFATQALGGSAEARVAAEQMADDYGLTRDSVNALSQSIEDVPTRTVAEIDADISQALGAVGTIKTEIRGITGRTVDINVRTVYTSIGTPGALSSSTRGGVTRATGGPVFGAGTETSDSIPALLSNNEHVWTGREVRGAGGHATVERLRALARAGMLPKFATGGPVHRFATGGPVAGGGVGIDYDRLAAALTGAGSQTIDQSMRDVTIYASDMADVRRKADRARKVNATHRGLG